MRVGLLTWHYYENVGSNLQAYAIQQIVKDLGHEAVFINYRYRRFDDGLLKRWVKRGIGLVDDLLPGLLKEEWRFGAAQFQRRRLSSTRRCYDKRELPALSGQFDAVVCGSDQIWAPNVFDDAYMLSFVQPPVRKIAYAPSIGLKDIPEALKGEYRKWIGRLDSVSVREAEGAQLIRECCGIEAEPVLDPTLLLTAERWMALCAREKKPAEGYVFSYLMGNKTSHRVWIREFAKRQGKPLVLFSGQPEERAAADVRIGRMGPEKFLKCLAEADIVLTDSFHGMAFSILFEKPFYVFDRFEEPDALCQNSRISNLASLLGLEDRRIRDERMPGLSTPNYEVIRAQLEENRTASIAYLKRALSAG